jgi:predicted amidohydrolase
VEKSARAEARLIFFGETFLSGYAAWLAYCPKAALCNKATLKEV